MRSLILSFTLIASTLAATPPRLGNERPVEQPPWHVDPPGARSAMVTMAGSDGFFGVWNDERGGDSRILGTRITTSGEVLDPLGIVLTPDIASPVLRAAVWDGSDYVLFVDGSIGDDDATWMVRVAPDGTRRAGVWRTPLEPESSWTAGANERGELLILMHTFAGGIAQFMERDGTFARARYPAASDLHSPAKVLAAGDEWIVLAAPSSPDEPALWARLTAARGVIAQQALGAGHFAHAAATDRRRTLVPFIRAEFRGGSVFAYTRGYTILDERGQVEESRQIDTTEREGEAASLFATAGWDGTTFVIAYAPLAGTGVFVTTSASRGQDLRVLPTESDALSFAFVHHARGNLLVTHEGDPGFPTRLRVRAFAAAASLDSAAIVPATLSATQQHDPRAASSGQSTFVAWREDGELRATIVERNNIALAQTIATNVLAHDVDATPDGFVVAWVDATRGGVRVDRFDRDGRRLTPESIVVHERSVNRDTLIAVAANATRTAVTWRDLLGTVHVATAASDGVFGPRQVVFQGQENLQATNLRLVDPGDGTFLLVWSEEQATGEESPGNYARINLSRIDASGTLGSAPVWLLSSGFGAVIPYMELDAAWNGEELLVAWSWPGDDEGSTQCLHARRFTVAGVPRGDTAEVLCAPRREPASEPAIAPSVASSGTRWLVVTPGENNALFAFVATDDTWSLAGELAPPISVVRRPELVSLPGRVEAYYTRNDASAGHVQRLFVRTISTEFVRQRAVRH